MDLRGNYWEKSPEPASKETIRGLLLSVFKEMRYNHYNKKIVVDYTPSDVDPSYCKGMASSYRLCPEVCDDYDEEDYEDVQPSEPDFNIWIGIPQVFDACDFLATVEHEVEHLQSPRMEHDLMPRNKDLIDLWKDRTGSEDCLRKKNDGKKRRRKIWKRMS